MMNNLLSVIWKSILLAVLTGTSMLGTVSFERVVAVEGVIVHSAQAADYNKDGLKDLIYSGGGGVNLAMAPGFEVIQIATTPAPLKPNCIYSTIMDVDNDGDMDFLGCNRGLYWLECPDNPVDPKQWKLHWITKAFSGTHCITVHDVDEDGKQDIVANNFFPSPHSVEEQWPNEFPNSLIWFKVPKSPRKTSSWKPLILAKGDAVGGSHYIDFGDLNGDGHDEAFHGAKGEPFENGHYYAYWTRGDDVYAPWKKTTLPGSHTGATHIYDADLNNDGLNDLVTSQGHGKGITWFKAPDYDPIVIDDQLVAPHAFRIADIEGDGDVDLFACAKGSRKAQWFENDGKGNFTRHPLSDDQESYDIVITDMDYDQDLDVIIAGQGSKNIVLFFQR